MEHAVEEGDQQAAEDDGKAMPVADRHQLVVDRAHKIALGFDDQAFEAMDKAVVAWDRRLGLACRRLAA